MKQKFTFLFLAAILILAACSKKNNPKPPPNIRGSVIINGTTYSTIIIGDQTWTTQNYDGPGGIPYGNNNAADTNGFGKLYLYPEATSLSLPSGWRLPTSHDFLKLMIKAGWPDSIVLSGKTLLNVMSTTGWNYAKGTDSLGFNAKPAGYYGYINSGAGGPDFQEKGVMAVFLTSYTYNGNDETFDVAQFIPYNQAYLTSFDYPITIARASIRFVKDN